MRLRQKDQKALKTYANSNRSRILTSPFLRTGIGRSYTQQEDNFREIQSFLKAIGVTTADDSRVKSATLIIEKEIGRTIEVLKPDPYNIVDNLIKIMKRDETDVELIKHEVKVNLDIDQLKHQHPRVPIGTRKKGGGTRFVESCDKDWHIANTLDHMADWANGLDMKIGEQIFHGQTIPVEGICYEGFCLMDKEGAKHVLFHCYPKYNTHELAM